MKKGVMDNGVNEFSVHNRVVSLRFNCSSNLYDNGNNEKKKVENIVLSDMAINLYSGSNRLNICSDGNI